MRFLIVGCGSIGNRHAENLQKLGQEVWLYDRDIVKLDKLVKRLNVGVYDFKGKHLSFAGWIITTPSNYHIPFAFEALEHNVRGIFIEKPISHNLDRVDELLDKAKEQNKLIQVGYQLRFHSGLQLIKKLLDEGRIGKLLSIRAEFGQYLPDWRPNEDYRNLYTCYEEQGGGIILDASHEIDYVRWLVDSEVKSVSCFADKLSSLEVNTEDTAEINLRFENGVIGNIHIDFTQRAYTRICKLIGEERTIVWDYEKHWIMINRYRKYIGGRDPYLEEMEHFISCLEGKEKPIVDGETGKRVLEIALACKQSAKENKVVGV